MEQLDVLELLRALQVLERNVAVSLMYAGLRVPQFRLLAALEEMGQATVTQMSARLHITRATASVMINELIRAGIIVAVENTADRRSFHVRLTEIGSNKLHVARSDVAVLQQKVSHRYPEETIRLLNRFAAVTLVK